MCEHNYVATGEVVIHTVAYMGSTDRIEYDVIKCSKCGQTKHVLK